MITVFGPHLLGLGFLYFAAYLPVRLVLHPADTRPSIADFFVYLFIGWSALAVFGALVLLFRLPFVLVLLIPITVFVLRFRALTREILLINWTSFRSFPAYFIAGIAIGMPLLGSFLMGIGEFPRFFLGVDTPYYLMHVHALSSFNFYPPPNLGLFDASPTPNAYHFGTSMMAATLTRLTTLAPHTSTFYYLVPALLASTVATASWLLRSSAIRQPALPLGLGFLVLFFLLPIHEDLIRGIFTNPLWAVARFANVELFGHGFPMFSTQYGIVAALLLFCCLIQFADLKHRIIFIFVMSSLFFFKSSHYVSLGIGIAGWAGLSIILERNWKLFQYACVALVCSVILQSLLSSPADSLIVSPFYHIQFLNVSVFAGIIPILCVLVFLVWRCRLISSSLQKRLLYFSCFLTGPFLFANIFRLERIKVPGDAPMAVGDLLQVLDIVPIATSVFILILASATLPTLTKQGRMLIVGGLILLSTPALLHGVYTVARTVGDPKFGHEYVSNVEIAEVLKYVPSDESTLVATNSLFYPTQPSPTKNKQLQIPSVHGNKCYACVFSPVENRVADAAARFKKQQVFSKPLWTRATDRVAREAGITHFVIDKEYPYPTGIPGRLVIETNRYLLYQLNEIIAER